MPKTKKITSDRSLNKLKNRSILAPGNSRPCKQNPERNQNQNKRKRRASAILTTSHCYAHARLFATPALAKKQWGEALFCECRLVYSSQWHRNNPRKSLTRSSFASRICHGSSHSASIGREKKNATFLPAKERRERDARRCPLL